MITRIKTAWWRAFDRLPLFVKRVLVRRQPGGLVCDAVFYTLFASLKIERLRGFPALNRMMVPDDSGRLPWLVGAPELTRIEGSND